MSVYSNFINFLDRPVCPVCDMALDEEDLCPTLEVCHACLHYHDGLPKLIRSIESSINE